MCIRDRLGTNPDIPFFNMNSKLGKYLNTVNPNEYWANEEISKDVKGREVVNNYLLQNTDKETIKALTGIEGKEGKLKLIRVNMARHEMYKRIFGSKYYNIRFSKLFDRAKLPFSKVTTNESMPSKKVMVFDPTESELVLTQKTSGKKIKTSLMIDTGKDDLEYMFDGESFTSEKNFKYEYPKYLGTKKRANHLKSVWYRVDDNGTYIVKHQENTFLLPLLYEKAELVDKEGNVFATFKRDSEGLVNIYDSNNEIIDMINTPDETKIKSGQYDVLNKSFEIPGSSVGLIHNPNENQKLTGKFLNQATNFMPNEIQQELINAYLNKDPERKHSRFNKTKELLSLHESPDKLNQFIIRRFNSTFDAFDNEIVESAKLGAGFHPSTTGGIKNTLKNFFLHPMSYLEMYGTYLKFKGANFISIKTDGAPLKDNEIIMPYDHVFINNIYKIMGAKLKRIPSKEEVNNFLNKEEIYVAVGRSPVASKFGLWVYRVAGVENMGDQFIISPKMVKIQSEADFDGDSANVVLLDKKLDSLKQALLKRQKSLSVTPLNIPVSENMDQGNIGNIDDLLDIQVALQKGDEAIGITANATRNLSIISSWFKQMNITTESGQVVKIKMRNMDDVVRDDFIGEDNTISEFLRKYTQAAVDHIKLFALDDWRFDEQGQARLYSMAFYDINNPDKPINEGMYKAFIKPFLVDTLKIVQNISNGFDFENGTLSYENYFELSQQYEQYVNTRLDSKITTEGSKVDFIGKEGVHTLYETMVLGYNGLAKLGMTKDFFNIDFGKSTLIHQVSMQNLRQKMSDEIIDLAKKEIGSNKVIDLNQHLNMTKLSTVANTLYSELIQAFKTNNKIFDKDNTRRTEDRQLSQQVFNTNEQIRNIYSEYIDQTADLTPSQRKFLTLWYLTSASNPNSKKAVQNRNVRLMPPARKDSSVPAILDGEFVEMYFTEWNDNFMNFKSNVLGKEISEIVQNAEDYIKQTYKRRGCVV